MIRRLPISTLFPYTTLFRSLVGILRLVEVVERGLEEFLIDRLHTLGIKWPRRHDPLGAVRICPGVDHAARPVLLEHPRIRSEEHTSELQSHSDLVCRLLLEK